MASTEEPQPPSLSSLARGNDMIVVEVGPNRQRYRVYKELISFYSEYFRNALKEPWKEAEDRLIELPDIEPQVFDIFVDWLYTQKVPEKNRFWVAPTETLKANSTEHVQLAEILVMKTYVFADRFLVPKLRCAIYNYFAASLTKDSIPPYYEAIIYAFNNLTEKSAMLDLLVGLHCAFWDESCDTESNGEVDMRKDLPIDFLLRVMIQSSKMKDKERAKSMVECGCHKEKAKNREGCDSCRPEEKVEEEAATEAEGSGAQNGNNAQAGGGDEADAGQNDEEAGADGDGEEEEDEAGDGPSADEGAQASNSAQHAEGEGSEPSANDAQPSTSAPQPGPEMETAGQPQESSPPETDTNQAAAAAAGEDADSNAQVGAPSQTGSSVPVADLPSGGGASASPATLQSDDGSAANAEVNTVPADPQEAPEVFVAGAVQSSVDASASGSSQTEADRPVGGAAAAVAVA